MISVGVNPPHTPVTAGSDGISAATTPNVCKMPGPPAPFVPTPLPNIGQSGDRPGDYTQTVKIEGKAVAIRGSYFMSKGDIASKGTGGGLISAATHGKTEFVAPGSMNVNAEGQNIQYLGDLMTNNGASPSNGGMTPKEVQTPSGLAQWQEEFLCAIFCACLGQWKSHHHEMPLSDLTSIEDPGFDAHARADRFERQGCVEQELRNANNPNFVPEQPYDMSHSPPRPGEGSPMRIPDVAVLAGPGQASGTNLTAIVEMKFPGDTYRPGQRSAYERIAKENNPDAVFVPMDEDSCECQG